MVFQSKKKKVCIRKEVCFYCTEFQLDAVLKKKDCNVFFSLKLILKKDIYMHESFVQWCVSSFVSPLVGNKIHQNDQDSR